MNSNTLNRLVDTRLVKLAVSSNVIRNAKLTGKVGLGLGGVLGALQGASVGGLLNATMKNTNNMEEIAKAIDSLKTMAPDDVRSLALSGIRDNIPLTLATTGVGAGLGGLQYGALGALLGAGATGAYNLAKPASKSDYVRRLMGR